MFIIRRIINIEPKTGAFLLKMAENIEIEDDEFLWCVTQLEEIYFKEPRNYTLFSGGANGSDLYWQKKATKLGIRVRAFSFSAHAKNNKARVVLSKEQLEQADEHLILANQTVKRHFPTRKSFVDNLLRRNWYQVKDTLSVFAIAKLSPSQRTVEGGTGWAVQMAVDQRKDVYVFDTVTSKWHKFDNAILKFVRCKTPKLTLLSTGIGTRQLTDTGRKAIENVFEATFKL